MPEEQLMMPYPAEVIEIDIDGRTFWVRPVGSWVLESGNVVAQALVASLIFGLIKYPVKTGRPHVYGL